MIKSHEASYFEFDQIDIQKCFNKIKENKITDKDLLVDLIHSVRDPVLFE